MHRRMYAVTECGSHGRKIVCSESYKPNTIEVSVSTVDSDRGSRETQTLLIDREDWEWLCGKTCGSYTADFWWADDDAPSGALTEE